VVLAAVFLVQIVTAVRVVRAEVAEPFSGAYEAAQFLRSRGWQNALLIGNGDYAATAVTGYLDRPFLSAETGELGPFRPVSQSPPPGRRRGCPGTRT
jgi:hypothetical protein